MKQFNNCPAGFEEHKGECKCTITYTEEQTAGQMIYPCEKCKKIYCEKGCGDEDYCKSCGVDLPPK